MKVKAIAPLYRSGFISFPQAENIFSETACVTPTQSDPNLAIQAFSGENE